MFSKTIVCALFVFSAAAACVSCQTNTSDGDAFWTKFRTELDEASALVAAIKLDLIELDQRSAEWLTAADLELIGTTAESEVLSVENHFRNFCQWSVFVFAASFLAALAVAGLVGAQGRPPLLSNVWLIVVLVVLWGTVSSAELLNVSEVESDIDAIYAKFQAKWEQESAEIAALELELASASTKLERVRQLEIFAIENQIAVLRQQEISAMENKIESLRQLAEASAELEQARQLEIYAIENQFEIYRQWPDAKTAWPVCVIIAQLVVGAFVALTAVKVLVRVFRIMMRVLYYLLVGIFCIVNCGLVVFTIYLVFYYEWKTY